MVVKIINKSNNQLPKYETPRSAGMDIRVDFSRISPQNPIKAYGDCEVIYKGESHNTTMLRLEPGSRALIPTGIFTTIPEGYEVQIRPRSGLAIKKGLNGKQLKLLKKLTEQAVLDQQVQSKYG